MSRWTGRKVVNAVVLCLIAAFVLVAAFVLPRIYDARYKPEPGEPPAPITPAPAFTAEQEQAFIDNTMTNAAHPGTAVNGRDGFYFLGDSQNANISQALGRRTYSPAEIAQVGGALTAQQKYLESKGITMAYVVAPAKWSVYEDKLPEWSDGMPKTHIFDQMLEAYPDLPYVDVRQELKDARSTAETFSPMNSHWTDYGAYVAFDGIRTWLQERDPDVGDIPMPEISGIETIDYNNELDSLFGIEGANPWTKPQYAAPLPSYEIVAGDQSRASEPGEILDISAMPLTTKYADAPSKSKVLVMSDSTVSAVSPLIAASFSEAMWVRHWLDSPDRAPSIAQLVEDFQPDVVIYFMTERHFNIPVNDGPVWDGANRFDESGTTLAQWPGTNATVCQGEPSLSSPLVCRVDAGQAVVLQIKATSDQPSDIQLKAGDHQVNVHLGEGQSTGYAVLPSQIANNDIVMTAITPGASVNITSVEIRAVP